jgi:hypothetical protein
VENISEYNMVDYKDGAIFPIEIMERSPVRKE